nr:ATP synthase F0 subunit 6 [Paradorydium reflexanum]
MKVMTNLFSSFDPTTGTLSMNWMSMILFMMLPLSMWKINSKINLMINLINKFLMKEISLISKESKVSILFVSMFLLILINNIMGLLPYVFTATAHLSFSLSIALTTWLSLMMFGWTKKTNQMFKHLVPTGTPTLLIPLMIIIETISNMIRPLALSVRLSANMIAGHLLMTLLGNKLTTKIIIIMFISMTSMLMIFELAVAMIQSYVFVTLSNLYFSEI